MGVSQLKSAIMVELNREACVDFSRVFSVAILESSVQNASYGNGSERVTYSANSYAQGSFLPVESNARSESGTAWTCISIDCSPNVCSGFHSSIRGERAWCSNLVFCCCDKKTSGKLALAPGTPRQSHIRPVHITCGAACDLQGDAEPFPIHLPCTCCMQSEVAYFSVLPGHNGHL
jgi:hypothetical protein